MGDHEGPEEPMLDIPNRIIPSPRVRRYVYGVALAAGGLLVAYGVTTPEQWGHWITLAGAVLNLGTSGLALANTPKTT